MKNTFIALGGGGLFPWTEEMFLFNLGTWGTEMLRQLHSPTVYFWPGRKILFDFTLDAARG